MNQNPKGVTEILIVMILAFAVTIGIGYWAYKNGQIKFNLSPKQLTVSPTLSPSLNVSWKIDRSNIPNGWKLYLNEKINYQIAYPDSWNFEEKNPDLKTWVTLFKGEKDQYGRYTYEININDWFIEAGLDNKVDIEEIKLDSDEGGYCADGPEGGTCVESQSPQEVTVKTLENISNYYHVIKYSGKIAAYIPVANQDQKFIKIELSNWPENESFKTFNQILSTFKFTN